MFFNAKYHENNHENMYVCPEKCNEIRYVSFLGCKKSYHRNIKMSDVTKSVMKLCMYVTKNTIRYEKIQVTYFFLK